MADEEKSDEVIDENEEQSPEVKEEPLDVKKETIDVKKESLDVKKELDESSGAQEDTPVITEQERVYVKKEPPDSEEAAEVTKSPSDIKEADEPTRDEGKPEIKREPSETKKPTPPKPPYVRSDDDYRLRKIFRRPRYAEPRHPIFSSLFCRHISAMAFGPKKPKWYTPLTSAQLYLFKDIMNYVEIGRENLFRFDDFLEALQDFDSSITREEVLNIIDSMEKNEFEELDFGKFLFLLAYRDKAANVDDPEDIDETLKSKPVTPRQCLFLSAISYFILIASPEEIGRYYFQNTRRKATVLHYHLEASRLQGLTERQMEVKQRQARKHLGPIFELTGSPYAYPVPFVPRFKKAKLFREWTKRRLTSPKSALPMMKKPIVRPIVPIEPRRQLGEKVEFESEEDKIFSQMNYGRIPLPEMKIPSKKLAQMRKKCTVEYKDYIMKKAYEAVSEYKDRLRKASVIYSQRNLKPILRQGFPTFKEEKDFIEMYERYMPLKLSDVKDFSLWVKPAGYGSTLAKKPLFPDKFAFGSKIQ